MFDKLEDLLIRYEEIMGELQEPDVVNDQSRFRKLMKEQNALTPIVEAYKEYKNCKQNIEDSLSLLEEESDEEMKELAKEELSESKKESKSWNRSSRSFFFQKTRTMTRTLSWRSVQVQVEMKLPFLRLRSTVCMYIMQTADAGRQR